MKLHLVSLSQLFFCLMQRFRKIYILDNFFKLSLCSIWFFFNTILFCSIFCSFLLLLSPPISFNMLNILFFFFWLCGLWGSFFPDQGLISCPGCESLASKPLDHQEIPWTFLFYNLCLMIQYLSWLVWFYCVLFLKMVMVIYLEVCVISDLWLLICEYYQKPRLRKTFPGRCVLLPNA